MVFRRGGLSASPSSIFGQIHPLLLRRRLISRRPWAVLGLWSPVPPPEGSARCFVVFRCGYWARGRGRCPSVRCVIHFLSVRSPVFCILCAPRSLASLVPRAFSFPGCFRSREARPGHARSREWSARSVAGPQEFLEPFGGLSFVLSGLLRCVCAVFRHGGLMKFIPPSLCIFVCLNRHTSPSFLKISRQPLV